MKEITLVNVMPSAREYFCNDCGQLRLSPSSIPTYCGNCYSEDIVIGELNSLDKDSLKADWERKQL